MMLTLAMDFVAPEALISTASTKPNGFGLYPKVRLALLAALQSHDPPSYSQQK